MYKELQAEKSEYMAWVKLSIMADCLRDLGYDLLAQNIMSSPINYGKIEKYLSFLEKKANDKKDNDVLNRLYFYGLIIDQQSNLS